MEQDRKLSLCIPTWNRFELLIDSFLHVLHDDRISEITICDDASDIGIYEQVERFVDGIPKIKLFRNEINLDCYKNKHRVVELASNEWCIVFDSDNVLKTDYIDKIFSLQWDENTIYAPTFAMPTFNYRLFSGFTLTSKNISHYIGQKMWDTALNTMNFFVNRDAFLKVWDGDVNPNTADSIYFNYCWLNSGKEIFFVPDLSYFHRVHQDSHYILNNHKTNGFYEEVITKLSQLV